MDASIGYAISGNSPSTVTTATVGSVIDTASADGAGNGLGLDLVDSIDVVYAGTGGTGGVSYLAKALELRFFPELWTIRTSM